MLPVYLNGRFLVQAVTGVQRFAREITAALDRLAERGEAPLMAMLTPPGPPPSSIFRTIRIRMAGRMRGHVWEQIELPFYSRNGVLINLGNAAPVLGRRQIVVLHDAGIFAHPEAYSLPYRLLHRSLERMLVRTHTRLVTVSHFSRDEIARHLRVSPRKIDVISEGADHILRVPADRAVLELHGLRPHGYVLAVGSVVAHKNLVALQELAQMLARRGLELAIAGGIAPNVFDAKRLNLPQPARYLGRVSDGALRALYEDALCFVFPSRYEGFGIPPVEAMACGCPVVAATAGAVMEICGDAALYADPDDPVGIAAAVGRIIDEPDFTDALRERGRKRVRALTWDNAAIGLIPLIKRLQREPWGQPDESSTHP